MTNWKAVLTGFLAELVFNILGIFVGIVSPGIVAGLVAGYLSGTRLLSGAWHGLLAGGLGGFVLAVLVAVTGVGYGLLVDPVGSVIGLGLALALLFVMLLFAVDSAIGGMLGAGVARLTSSTP